MQPSSPPPRISPSVVVVAVVALAFIVAGVLIATLFAPAGRDATLIGGFITAVVGAVIPALVNLLRTDKTNRLVADVQAKVNGHMDQHENLTMSVARSAASAAEALNHLATGERDPNARTRAIDAVPPATSPDLPVPSPVSSPPLADQI